MPLTAQHRPDVLGGVTVIQGPVMALKPAEWPEQLYLPAAQEPGVTRIEFTAIPYFANANREPGEMIVWMPEIPSRPIPDGRDARALIWEGIPGRAWHRFAWRTTGHRSKPRRSCGLTSSIRRSNAWLTRLAECSSDHSDLERSHVDGEAVLHIGPEQSLVGFVDLLDGDDFDIGGDVVCAAKVKHLLRLAMPPMFEPAILRRPMIREKAKTSRGFAGRRQG